MLALVYFLGLLTVAYARVHHLIVGNLNLPGFLYVLEFDDQTLDFRIASNHTAESSHAWITFGQTKNTILGASINSSVTSQYELTLTPNRTSLDLVGSAPNCDDRGSAYVLSASSSGASYGVAWPGPAGCGTAFPSPLVSTAQTTNWTYTEDSAVHGLALAFNDTVLYSADLGGNAIWTHRVGGGGEGEQQQVEQVGRLAMTGDLGPRHLLVHPRQQYLHVIMETANQLSTFDLDEDTHEPRRAVSVWPILPGEAEVADYWAAEVALSPNGRYLWVSTRGRAASDPGYLSAYLLSEDGYVERRMLTVKTTTPGGAANSVSPAPWSDEIVAMTDYGTGYVEIWQMRDPREGSEEPPFFLNATAVARVDIKDGGCCANVLWYD